MVRISVTLRGVALCFVACLLACTSMFGGATAAAQTTGGLVVAKTSGAGREGEAPVANAVFRVRELVGMPVQSQEELSSRVLAEPRLLTGDPGFAFGYTATATTDDAGIATFVGLPEGVYQVSEVSQRTSNTAETLTSPFLVAVHAGVREAARAKTLPNIVEKSSDKQSVKVGDTVVYSISTTIPPVDASGRLHQLVVSDDVDSRLSYVKVRSVSVENLGGRTELRADQDYSVNVEGPSVRAELRDAGLDKAAAARKDNPEARLHLELEVRVDEGAAPGDHIPNVARFSPDGYCVLGPGQGDDSCPAGQPAPESSPAAIVSVVSAIGPTTPSSPTAPTTDSGGWWRPIKEKIGIGSSSGEQGASDQSGITDREAPPRQHEGLRGALASTGASVIGIVLAAVAVIILGVVLVRRRRDEDEEEL